MLTSPAIARESRQGSRQSVDPHERRTDQAQLNFIEAKLFFEFREHGKNGLAIGIVEKTNEPEHEHDPPLIARGDPARGG